MVNENKRYIVNWPVFEFSSLLLLDELLHFRRTLVVLSSHKSSVESKHTVVKANGLLNTSKGHFITSWKAIQGCH